VCYRGYCHANDMLLGMVVCYRGYCHANDMLLGTAECVTVGIVMAMTCC